MTSSPEFKAANLYDLQGLIALVTGGGTGIGLMIAQGFAANGAQVYITGRREDILYRIANEWNQKKEEQMGCMVAMRMDVTTKRDIEQAVAKVERDHGKLHILVNNAGQLGPRSPDLNTPSSTAAKDAGDLSKYLFLQESFEEWSGLYTINVSSIYFVTVAFLGLLDKGSNDRPGFTSSVINITSVSGVIKLSQCHSCYNSTKAAASHLTKMLATEFALKQIPVRVNAIAPGLFESEMTPIVINPDGVLPGEAIVPIPAGRFGSVSEMTGTAVYLASPAASYVNGQEVILDGGYTSVNPSKV